MRKNERERFRAGGVASLFIVSGVILAKSVTSRGMKQKSAGVMTRRVGIDASISLAPSL
jgi:hypothetical protein